MNSNIVMNSYQIPGHTMKIVNYSVDTPTQWLSCRSNCQQDTKRNDTIEKLSVHYLNIKFTVKKQKLKQHLTQINYK